MPAVVAATSGGAQNDFAYRRRLAEVYLEPRGAVLRGARRKRVVVSRSCRQRSRGRQWERRRSASNKKIAAKPANTARGALTGSDAGSLALLTHGRRCHLSRG